MDNTEHWENVYQSKSSAEVSWYEPDPKKSLELIVGAAGDSRGRVELLKRSLTIGGHFIVGTFGKGGPEKCSGLQICQYDAATMQEALGSSFVKISECEYLHTTPSGKPQLFFFGVFRKKK
jgi:hypothetical protein